MVFKIIENNDNLNYFQEVLSSDVRKGWRSYGEQTRGPQGSTIDRRPIAHSDEEKQKFTLYNTPMDGVPASLPSCNSKLIMLMDFPLKMIFFQK